MPNAISSHLGAEAESLLKHVCVGIPKESLQLPGPDFVDRVWARSDRGPQVLRSLQQLFDHGRLGGTGYLSILPVDQGIEHSAGASFAPNPAYFDPRNIVAARRGGRLQRCRLHPRRPGLGLPRVRPPHPFHPEVQPQRVPHLSRTSSTRSCSPASSRHGTWAASPSEPLSISARPSPRGKSRKSARPSRPPTSSGWRLSSGATCGTPPSRPPAKDFHVSADLTGQANHLGVTIEADIIKQKLPENNGGYLADLEQGKPLRQDGPADLLELAPDNPIDLARYQVANCYMGRCGLINSGGASGANDLAEAVRTAVINKRAGGRASSPGRKAFQKPMAEGVRLLHAIQDVYLSPEVTIA